MKKNYYFIPFHLNKDKLNYFTNGSYRNSKSNIRLILKWRDVDLNQGNRWNIHIIQLNIRLYLYYSTIVRLNVNLNHSTLTLQRYNFILTLYIIKLLGLIFQIKIFLNRNLDLFL